jgi:hypothetical protein
VDRQGLPGRAHQQYSDGRRVAGTWQWTLTTRPGAPLADELALLTGTASAAVLRTLGADRFRRCASPSCAGVFIDTAGAAGAATANPRCAATASTWPPTEPAAAPPADPPRHGVRRGRGGRA